MKEIFIEAVEDLGGCTYETPTFKCVMYKGFKFIHPFDDSEPYIKCTQINDFYTEPSSEEVKIILMYGFVEGVDRIVHDKNIIRVKTCEEQILKLHKQKSELLKSKGTVKMFDKKYRIVTEHLNNSVDLLFFYKSKISQFEKKYKLNNN